MVPQLFLYFQLLVFWLLSIQDNGTSRSTVVQNQDDHSKTATSKCGKKGHLAKVCRSKDKDKTPHPKPTHQNKRRPRRVRRVEAESEEDFDPSDKLGAYTRVIQG